METAITQENFVEQNPTVKNWLEELARKSKGTAINYGCQFYNYWLWLKEKRYDNLEQLLEECKDTFHQKKRKLKILLSKNNASKVL